MSYNRGWRKVSTPLHCMVNKYVNIAIPTKYGGFTIKVVNKQRIPKQAVLWAPIPKLPR